jgi:hypothetical protein
MAEVNFLVKKGLTVPKGSASTPAIIFDAADPNCGFYSPAADQIATSLGGSASAPALSLGNDPDTGLYSPGANQLAVATNGTGRLFIDASGNVGVGTASPSQPLHVNGDVRLGGPTGAVLSGGAGQNVVFGDAAAPLTAGTAFQNVAIGYQSLISYTGTGFTANTAVGHGTLRFTTSGTYNAALGIIAGTAITTGNYNTLLGFGAGSSITTGSSNVVIGGAAGTATLANTVLVSDGAGNERLRIDSSGRLGIGTSAPTQRLTVFNPTFGVPATSGTTQTNGAFRIGATGTSGVLDFGIGAAGTNQWIQSTDSNNLSLGYVLLLNPNGGNVGIGTTSPSASALLDVTSTTAGFLPPRMTTAQRDAISSPAAGLTVYNTSTNKLNFYNGSAWEAVTSA